MQQLHAERRQDNGFFLPLRTYEASLSYFSSLFRCYDEKVELMQMNNFMEKTEREMSWNV
jgi:hypothetical protein